jgi:hypothetical protein
MINRGARQGGDAGLNSDWTSNFFFSRVFPFGGYARPFVVGFRAKFIHQIRYHESYSSARINSYCRETEIESIRVSIDPFPIIY